MTSEQQREIVDRAAVSLGEHFDAVQILVSVVVEGGNTRCIKSGNGNWYSRQGMAHEFIQQESANQNACEIASKLNPPDGGDDWKHAAT